jgi:hypothetical protein
MYTNLFKHFKNVILQCVLNTYIMIELYDIQIQFIWPYIALTDNKIYDSLKRKHTALELIFTIIADIDHDMSVFEYIVTVRYFKH